MTKELELKIKLNFWAIKTDSIEIDHTLADLGLSLEEDGGISYRYALPNKIFDYSHAGIHFRYFLPEIKIP